MLSNHRGESLSTAAIYRMPCIFPRNTRNFNTYTMQMRAILMQIFPEVQCDFALQFVLDSAIVMQIECVFVWDWAQLSFLTGGNM